MTPRRVNIRCPGQTSKAGNIPTNNPVRRRKFKSDFENKGLCIIVSAVTQADQDKADEEKHREAIENLVQTWLSRLQLISVIVSKLPTLTLKN